ncbi:MAG: hypothetical protein O2820_10670 [Planctomycetota bacterium]|nr:hypothetical protein [Planctomycetota bacterium]MDA1249673.1 hypothetical protein [Planctomycetota bacterium]
MRSFKRTSLAVLTISVIFAAISGVADDKEKSEAPEAKPLVKTKPLTKVEKAVAQEALGAFNAFIGGWRGAGQVRRGSRDGAWQEDGVFVWNFDDGGVAIQYDIKEGKHIRKALVTWDAKTKKFQMTAAFADKVEREYIGNFEKDVFILESKPDADENVSRVTMRQLNEKRMLVLYESRKESQSFYRRLGEVGYTREGTRLASSDSTGPECVVSGGAGTIAVSFKGKTYYVCCTGCRDAFNDDPEGILADYKAKLEERKKKNS